MWQGHTTIIFWDTTNAIHRQSLGWYQAYILFLDIEQTWSLALTVHRFHSDLNYIKKPCSIIYVNKLGNNSLKRPLKGLFTTCLTQTFISWALQSDVYNALKGEWAKDLV